MFYTAPLNDEQKKKLREYLDHAQEAIEYKENPLDEFVKSAIEAGFTQTQAEFLFWQVRTNQIRF